MANARDTQRREEKEARALEQERVERERARKDPFWASVESRRKRELLEIELNDAEWILEYEKRLAELQNKMRDNDHGRNNLESTPSVCRNWNTTSQDFAAPSISVPGSGTLIHQPHRIPLWVRFFLTTFSLLNPFLVLPVADGSIHRLILSSTTARGIVYRPRERSIIFVLRPYRMKSGAKVLPKNGSPSLP
jgi:hypothetical protein